MNPPRARPVTRNCGQRLNSMRRTRGRRAVLKPSQDRFDEFTEGLAFTRLLPHHRTPVSPNSARAPAPQQAVLAYLQFADHKGVERAAGNRAAKTKAAGPVGGEDHPLCFSGVGLQAEPVAVDVNAVDHIGCR